MTQTFHPAEATVADERHEGSRTEDWVAELNHRSSGPIDDVFIGERWKLQDTIHARALVRAGGNVNHNLRSQVELLFGRGEGIVVVVVVMMMRRKRMRIMLLPVVVSHDRSAKRKLTASRQRQRNKEVGQRECVAEVEVKGILNSLDTHVSCSCD